MCVHFIVRKKIIYLSNKQIDFQQHFTKSLYSVTWHSKSSVYPHGILIFTPSYLVTKFTGFNRLYHYTCSLLSMVNEHHKPYQPTFLLQLPSSFLQLSTSIIIYSMVNEVCYLTYRSFCWTQHSIEINPKFWIFLIR